VNWFKLAAGYPNAVANYSFAVLPTTITIKASSTNPNLTLPLVQHFHQVPLFHTFCLRNLRVSAFGLAFLLLLMLSEEGTQTEQFFTVYLNLVLKLLNAGLIGFLVGLGSLLITAL